MITLMWIGLVLNAPAPVKPPPEKVVVQLRSGTWLHTWGGSNWTVTLDDGAYLAVSEGGSRWEGSYEWDPVSRTWSVLESPDNGEHWYRWKAVLDDDGKGDAVGDLNAPVRIWERRKDK